MSREHALPDPLDVPRCVAARRFSARRYRDLCSTCKHAEACGGRSTLERPVFFCELFEVLAPQPDLTPVRAPESESRQDAGEYKGLCVNCANRTTCTEPRPESGVWHCEEYL